MKKLLGSALIAAVVAGLSAPVNAADSGAAYLGKDPLVVAGCEERAADEQIPAEGIAAFVKSCLEELANDLPLEETQEVAKKPAGEGKVQN